MLIDIQLRQRTQINLEFVLLRQGMGQRVIQTVDPLNDQDILRSQLQRISFIFLLSGQEIEGRHGYFLAS